MGTCNSNIIINSLTLTIKNIGIEFSPSNDKNQYTLFFSIYNNNGSNLETDILMNINQYTDIPATVSSEDTINNISSSSCDDPDIHIVTITIPFSNFVNPPFTEGKRYTPINININSELIFGNSYQLSQDVSFVPDDISNPTNYSAVVSYT